MVSKLIGATALAAVLAASPAYAHHPHDIFDNTQVLTITGTVSSFGWQFPHSTLVLDVTDNQGQRMPWTLEMGSPRQLERYGWNDHALMAGEEVSIVMYPRRDGTHAGAVLAVEFPNGVLMVDEEYWDYVDQYRLRR